VVIEDHLSVIAPRFLDVLPSAPDNARPRVFTFLRLRPQSSSFQVEQQNEPE
jgi:hypothetical protein